jgi:pimeloyl-ACP methyl ester carboxylesterase
MAALKPLADCMRRGSSQRAIGVSQALQEFLTAACEAPVCSTLKHVPRGTKLREPLKEVVEGDVTVATAVHQLFFGGPWNELLVASREALQAAAGPHPGVLQALRAACDWHEVPTAQQRACARALGHTARDVRALEIPQAGHLANCDNPHQFNRIMRDVLLACAARPR